MSYHHTLQAAVESLHEIETLINRFPVNGKIPSIEIDLAMQKLRNLYELLLMMKENEPDLIPELPSVQVEETKKTTVTVSASVEEIKTEHREETEIKREDTEIKTEKTDRRIISKKKSGDIQTLADQFQGGPTLLETLSESYKRESGVITRTKQISDLMAAIALNERFTFIRELFNNDKKEFEAAILALNDAGSYDSACSYLERYNWDMDDETVKLLLGLLRQKYNN